MGVGTELGTEVGRSEEMGGISLYKSTTCTYNLAKSLSDQLFNGSGR